MRKRTYQNIIFVIRLVSVDPIIRKNIMFTFIYTRPTVVYFSAAAVVKLLFVYTCRRSGYNPRSRPVIKPTRFENASY